MKALLLALVLVFGFQGVSCNQVTGIISTSPMEADEVMYHYMADRTLLVTADAGTGSGVVILEGTHVLTALHVVSHEEWDEEAQATKLVFEEAYVTKFLLGALPWGSTTKLVKYDIEHDLALLELGNKYPLTAELSKEVRLFQKCWASGHPLGVEDATVTEGRIQDLDEHNFMRYTSLTVFGNSGGPAWVLEGDQLKVVSVVQRIYISGMAPVTHMGLGARPSVLADFMAGL